MAFDAFLKLDGIKGEGSGETIRLESFSWGVSNSGSQASGGPGRVSFQDFSFTSLAGSEAPDLLLAAAMGKPIPKGTLSISDKASTFLTIEFKDVIISSYKLGQSPLTIKLTEGNAPLGAPMESVSFNFSQFVFQTKGGSTSGGLREQ